MAPARRPSPHRRERTMEGETANTAASVAQIADAVKQLEIVYSRLRPVVESLAALEEGQHDG